MKVKTGRNKTEWLNAFPKFRKFLNQCVVCQETGYDPVKLKTKQGKFFHKRAREFFHPLEVNELSICTGCSNRDFIAPKEPNYTKISADNVCALLSEPALAEDWNRTEEDAAWAHLQSPKSS